MQQTYESYLYGWILDYHLMIPSVTRLYAHWIGRMASVKLTVRLTTSPQRAALYTNTSVSLGVAQRT